MLKGLFFKSDPNREAAGAILTRVIAAARAPELFGPGKAPDTFDGRFQLVALHGALVMRRLRGVAEAAPLAQEFSDALFRSFDDGLREAGVGDISVPKHMKKMAKAFYGRLGAYDKALEEGGPEPLAAALSRNIWDKEAADFAPVLAGRALNLAERLAGAQVGQLADPALWSFA